MKVCCYREEGQLQSTMAWALAEGPIPSQHTGAAALAALTAVLLPNAAGSQTTGTLIKPLLVLHLLCTYMHRQCMLCYHRQ